MITRTRGKLIRIFSMFVSTSNEATYLPTSNRLHRSITDDLTLFFFTSHAALMWSSSAFVPKVPIRKEEAISHPSARCISATLTVIGPCTIIMLSASYPPVHIAFTNYPNVIYSAICRLHPSYSINFVGHWSLYTMIDQQTWWYASCNKAEP